MVTIEVINSIKYKQLLELYQSEQPLREPLLQDQGEATRSVYRVDFLTRLYVNSSLFLLLGSLAACSCLLPISVVDVVQLIFMTVLVVKGLTCKSIE